MATGFVLKGGRDMQARLRALGKAPPDLLREVGIRGVSEAKHLVPRRTGNLARTIRMGDVSASQVEIRAGGSLEVGYAAAVEYGTRPHVIVPRRRKVLAWGGPRTLSGRLSSGGQATNFARRVNHPGTQAKPFLFPGLERALNIVGLGSIVERWNRGSMTTFRVDVVEAVRVVLEAQKTATPTQLRKVYTSQPGAFPETPCAFIGNRSERIRYTGQTRTREMTGLEVHLVDALIDASETDDRMDAIIDLLVDRFTAAYAAVSGGGGLLQLTSVSDTLINIPLPNGGSVLYRDAVMGFGDPANPTFIMEGRA